MISFTTFYYIIINDREKRINIELQNNLHNLTVHHGLTLDYFHTDAQSIQSYVKNNLTILNLVKDSYQKPLEEQAKNREKLFNYLEDFYKRIKTRGVLQFQFMFPDNRTFLRMHKPEKFDDDLSEIRYSYKNTNETKKINFGFEHGRTSHSIRYVFPLFDTNNNHIGAAEVALSTNYIQHRLVNSSKLYTHYIVNKKILDTRAWKARGVPTKYLQSVEHDDFVFAVDSLHHGFEDLEHEKTYIKEKKEFIDEKFKIGEPFSFYIPLKDHVKLLSFVPVKNIKEKKVVAYIVAHSDSEKIQILLQDSKYIIIIGFILMAVFYYFIYKLLYHRETLKKEVEKQTYKLKTLNENLEKKVNEEVEKNQKAQEQIYKAEKMIALGDMIENIAHQWRQPLSVILTAASSLKLDQQLGTVNEEKITNTYNLINDNTLYLSKIIDEFSHIVLNNEEKKEFSLNELTSNFLKLTMNTVNDNHLQINVDIQDDITLNSYFNELTQCFLHLFDNSTDVLKNKKGKRYIFIDAHKEEKSVIITFKDNGGGIDQASLPRIFEPYYTTKHKSQGKGLSLHITYNMVTQVMGGLIDAKNSNYQYENETFEGAEFTITIPLIIK